MPPGLVIKPISWTQLSPSTQLPFVGFGLVRTKKKITGEVMDQMNIICYQMQDQAG